MTIHDLIIVLCLLGKGIGNVTSESARNGFAFYFYKVPGWRAV